MPEATEREAMARKIANQRRELHTLNRNAIFKRRHGFKEVLRERQDDVLRYKNHILSSTLQLVQALHVANPYSPELCEQCNTPLPCATVIAIEGQEVQS